MILKKPYAFLIRHFRLIHLIITLIFGYVAFSSRNIYIFLKQVIEDTTNRYNANLYINYNIFIFIFLALILCFLVSWLLKYKDKPRKIYKFTIGTYIVISIFMVILFSYMGSFSNIIMEQKTIRLYRDILTITLLFQYYIVFVMLIRGLGFDIKRFDFNKDMHELNLSEEDSEEVEVDTHIDTTNVMRLARKGKREFGYFFREFRGYIIIILVIILGIIVYNGYKYFNVKYKIYNENEYFGVNNIISIKNSYYAKYDSKNYVIIDFSIYKYGVKEQFNASNMALYVGNKKYVFDKNICYKFNDLGNCYKKQFITDNENNYILVYEVDNVDNDVYIVYTDYYDDNYKVKIDLKEY